MRTLWATRNTWTKVQYYFLPQIFLCEWSDCGGTICISEIGVRMIVLVAWMLYEFGLVSLGILVWFFCLDFWGRVIENRCLKTVHSPPVFLKIRIFPYSSIAIFTPQELLCLHFPPFAFTSSFLFTFPISLSSFIFLPNFYPISQRPLKYIYPCIIHTEHYSHQWAQLLTRQSIIDDRKFALYHFFHYLDKQICRQAGRQKDRQADR